MKKNKQEVITFKADESLLEALRGMPNRSEFIRNAILSSLDKICPTCKGTGTVLNPAAASTASAGHSAPQPGQHPNGPNASGRSMIGGESDAF